MMYTEADRLRDHAKESLEQAVEALFEMIVKKASGWEDYSNEYRARYRKAFKKAQKALELFA